MTAKAVGQSTASAARFSPPARVASQTALEKKAKEMEKNVKAAQAACLRDADNRTSSGRLKSLEVEAATLRRKLQAAESQQPAANAAQASASSSNTSPTPAVESRFAETSEAAPTIDPEEVAAVPENRRSPRSTSSSLRLKLESLVQEEEDDEQLAAEVHKVLVAEGAIGVTAVTSSAASASSASRVSPPRSPSDSPRKGKGRGKSVPKTASDAGLEVPRGSKTSSPEKQKPSPRPELENRPAWDDRFYVMEAPKPKRRSSLEEEHLAKDEVPKVPITRSPRPKTATNHGQSSSTEVPKRSPKAKAKAQEKAKAKTSPAAKALSAASFAAERDKRQASR